jgi:hypothetical protein
LLIGACPVAPAIPADKRRGASGTGLLVVQITNAMPSRLRFRGPSR